MLDKTKQWPPDYAKHATWRCSMLERMLKDRTVLLEMKAFYASNPAEFINDWVDTFDPRNALTGQLTKLPLDSIFEKMRRIVTGLPAVLRPASYDMSHMKMINGDNGATITGEAGDEIGRGGRKLIYFKDEAQPLDSKILTPAGWKIMADMCVGDKVIGLDGEAYNVTQVKDCGVHDVYRVTFSDGTFAECSPNHLWEVANLKKTMTLPAWEIAKNFSWQSGRGGQKFYRYRVPVCKPIKFNSAAKLSLDPYLLGAMLGDGHVNAKGGSGITSMDNEIVAQFAQLLPQGVVIKIHHEQILQHGRAHNYGIGDERRYCKDSRARQVMRQVGIAGLTAINKYIPDNYKFASVEDRLSLLQGLLDTDGSANAGVVSFVSISKQLAEDVRFIIQSLGGTATINYKPCRSDKFKSRNGTYVVHLAVPDGMIPFRLTRKIKSMKMRKHPPGRSILSVSLIDRRAVRCISVDAKDGLYLTDHCIVTHNSAHYEHPESIEAALSQNTNVQIDISSVSGVGTVFHRRREGGVDWDPEYEMEPNRTHVFVFDWRDHPGKDQQWYEAQKARAEEEGLLHVFRQEIDRDYAASQVATILQREWIHSAIDAHKKLEGMARGRYVAGLDVADGGGDKNALVRRKGSVLEYAEVWSERDTGVTARRAVDGVRKFLPVDLFYDCVGVGSGVKAEINRLRDEKILPREVHVHPWDAGGQPSEANERVISGDESSPLNKDHYANLKAQGWWLLRLRFERTHKAVTQGARYRPEDLISIPSDLPLLRQLEKELLQPQSKLTSNMRLMVDKQPEGTRSPNIADAVMMCFHPARENTFDTSLDWV
jgi:hypothetical protein